MVSLFAFEILFLPVWMILGGLSGLTLVNPELAFRYSNIFQLRDVELTQFGVVLHVGGSLLMLTVAVPYFLLRNPAIGWISVAAIYGSAGMMMFRHWPPKF